MAVASLDTLFDELTNFLVKRPTPDEIIAFKPSEAMSRRAHELLEGNRENTLSPAEHAELDEFMRIEHFMTLLKAKARLELMGKA